MFLLADLSTASVDLENIQEHEGVAPLDLNLGGEEIRFAFGSGPGPETKAAYHKPLVRDGHDMEGAREIIRSGKESVDRGQWKALKMADFSCSGDEEDGEPELEAIPESPKSETSDLAEFGGELEVLAPSVPTAELAEQARVRVVKDVLPGQGSFTVVDPSWQLAAEAEPVLVADGDIDTQMASQLSSFISSASDQKQGEDMQQQHTEKSVSEPMEKIAAQILPQTYKSDMDGHKTAEQEVASELAGEIAADRQASQSPSKRQNSLNVAVTGSPPALPADRKPDATSPTYEAPPRRPEVRLPDVHPSDIRGKVAAVKKVFEARATSDATAAFLASRRQVVSLDAKPAGVPKGRTMLTSKSTTDLGEEGDLTGCAPTSPSKSPKPRIHRMGAVDLGSLKVKPVAAKPESPLAELAAVVEEKTVWESPKKMATAVTVTTSKPTQVLQTSAKPATTEQVAPPKAVQAYVKEPVTSQRSLDMLTARLRGAGPKETVHR